MSQGCLARPHPGANGALEGQTKYAGKRQFDLKCFQKMARFCSQQEIPQAVTDNVRHCLGLAPDVEPGHGAARTARGPGSEREILVGYHDQRLCAFGGRGLIAATGWTV
jgi:hypothetical protein